MEPLKDYLTLDGWIRDYRQTLYDINSSFPNQGTQLLFVLGIDVNLMFYLVNRAAYVEYHKYLDPAAVILYGIDALVTTAKRYRDKEFEGLEEL